MPIMAEDILSKIIADKKNLERVLDNLKIGIIAHDLNRQIFYFNNEAERITGYSREEVLGKDCHQIFGEPLCGGQCSFSDHAPGFTDKKEYLNNIVTKNGEARRIEMSVTMMKDNQGRDFGVLASLADVTEMLTLSMKARELASFSGIVGKDAKMMTVFRQIQDVAGYDYPVHISGETGTGKELVAEAIHNESHRSGAPFVPINCGALPESLIESELFGHVKGAFSGALRDKKGRFELADKGTIFLDEIAEISKQIQIKLLRFLQDGMFEKVGGEKTVRVNVRVISATNKDLKKEIQQGNFRKDLFYRLNVIPIQLPPLRERKNDIPLLVDHFLKEAGEMHASMPPKISKEAVSLMMGYYWPGNVRELQNAIQFAIVNCNGDTIFPKDLPMELKDQSFFCSPRGAARKLNEEIVKMALEKSGGNKAKAARILGVGRATLYRFLSDHPHAFQR
jgi:sigma-54 dependent transcriptional regulator, acetoin dehydrogenase operon transcriptional activator AcoR